MSQAALPIKKSDHDEVRFTRNAQALHFFLAAIFLIVLALGLYVLGVRWGPAADPVLSRRWYGLLLIPLIALAAWTGWHCAKHAYLIFTPLGLEIFPFWFPSKNLQVFYWQELETMRLTENGRMIELIFKGEGDSRVFISTAPLDARSKELLAHAVRGVAERHAKADLTTVSIGDFN